MENQEGWTQVLVRRKSNTTRGKGDSAFRDSRTFKEAARGTRRGRHFFNLKDGSYLLNKGK